MAHSHIAIHAHHGEGQYACEHVVVVDGDEDLAHHLTKGPRVQQIVCILEGHGGGHQGIGQGQIEDVNVCGRLHLGVPWQRKKN